MVIPVGRLWKGLDDCHRIRYRRATTVFETAGTELEQLPSPDAGNTLDLAITEFW